jgi:hypothetical protein
MQPSSPPRPWSATKVANELVDAGGVRTEGDAYDLVAALLEGVRNASSSAEGDLALRAHPPHQDPNALLCHDVHLAQTA